MLPDDGARLVPTHTRPINLDIDFSSGTLNQHLDELAQKLPLTAAQVHDPAGVRVFCKLA